MKTIQYTSRDNKKQPISGLCNYDSAIFAMLRLGNYNSVVRLIIAIDK